MIEHSQEIGTIMSALQAVQQDVDHVSKDAKNPHYGNTYTTLNAFLHALRGPLADEGVIMTQGPGMDDGNVVVETMLYHADSGEWIINRAAAPMQKDDPQGAGSAITYLRRYSLASLFAVPQEDDDGNAASRTPQKRSQGVDKRTGEVTEFACPSCAGPMWNNTDDPKASRNGGKRPDWKCKDKGCDNAIWGHHPEELPDLVRKKLNDAATVGAVDVDKAADIEKLIENGELDRLRLAKDWLETQIQKKQADGSYDPAEDESAPEPQGV